MPPTGRRSREPRAQSWWSYKGPHYDETWRLKLPMRVRRKALHRDVNPSEPTLRMVRQHLRREAEPAYEVADAL